MESQDIFQTLQGTPSLSPFHPPIAEIPPLPSVCVRISCFVFLLVLLALFGSLPTTLFFHTRAAPTARHVPRHVLGPLAHTPWSRPIRLRRSHTRITSPPRSAGNAFHQGPGRPGSRHTCPSTRHRSCPSVTLGSIAVTYPTARPASAAPDEPRLISLPVSHLSKISTPSANTSPAVHLVKTLGYDLRRS